MKKKFYGKILVVGIILLFFGASITSSTNVNIEKKIDTTQIDEQKSSSSTDWWPMFHHDPQHTGYSTCSAPDSNMIRWSYNTGGDVISSPAVIDNKVYVGGGSKVWCLNAETGGFIWDYQTGGGVFSSPAVVNGKVYIGSSDGYVYCLNADNGNFVWIYSGAYPCDFESSPSVVDGKVYIANFGTMYLYCLNAENGNFIWKQYFSSSVTSSPAVVNGKVYITSDNGKLSCLNANTGNLIWSYTTGGSHSSPAVVNGKVYVGGNTNVWCLNAETGSFIWNYETGGFVLSSPAVINDKVYIGSRDKKLYCLNANNGNYIWSYTTWWYIDSSPAVADGKVYVGSQDNNVYCFNADTGNKIWSYQTGYPYLDSSPAVYDGKLYIGSRDNKIYCFGPVNPPTVSTNNATGIGTNHATLNGNLDNMGNASSCEVWFVWDTNYHNNWQDYTNETSHQTKSSTGPFSHFLDGLNPETLYHYRAVASNIGGTSQGDDVPFQTYQGPQPPHIDSITSYYADGDQYTSDGYGLILGGLDIENKYTVVVSGEVSYVTFQFGPQTSTDYNPPYEATFNYQYINPSDTLIVTAHQDTLADDEKTCYPKIVQMPSWMSLFAQYTLTYDYTDYISFSISEKVIPGEGRYWTIKASADFSEKWPGNEYQSPVYAYVPDGIPVPDVGGIYGYSGGVGSSLSICSDGTIDVSGGFHAGVEVKSIGGNVGASLHGKIEFDIPNHVIKWTNMYININGKVVIPVYVIPLEICDIGIEVCVDITPHAGFTFNFEPTANPNEGIVPGLGIKFMNYNGIIGDMGCKVQAYAEENFGDFNLYVEAGGDGTLYLQTPPDPTYFDDFILSCWIGAQLRIGYWTYEGWWTYKWTWSNQQRLGKEYNESGWQTLNTSYLYPDQGSYSNLPWNQTFYNGTLIENVFPYAHPCIAYNTASRENEVMMVMAHHNKQNQGDPVQNMEILWSEWNEKTGLADIWVIGPTRNDNKLQMDPRIAYDKNGNVVCVFIQTDSSINSNSNVMDALNATEIAYCIYDKNSGEWSDINLITSNNKMDASPVLASNTNGDVLLVWTSDDDNNHTTTNDRSIYTSFWDGYSWSNPTTIVENYSFLSGPAIAIHNNNEAICVFSKKIGNLEKVFYTRFQNGIWKNVEQFTNDAFFNETQPSAVYGTDGTPYIIWLKHKYYTLNGNSIYDGNLYYKPVGSTGTAFLITNGTIYDPVAIPSQSSKRSDVDFLVGWKSGNAANELRYTKIKTGERTNDSNGSLIYSSDKKLSEVSWCFMQDSISVETTDRETLRNGGKNCNLTFIHKSIIDNIPPDKPIISGPTKGKAGTKYEYTYISTDPEAYDVYYFVDWGDGKNTSWIGPFASGDPQIINHTWENKGTYTISAKAKDIFDAESDWNYLSVTIPRNRAVDIPVLRFFKNHQSLFKIIQLLFKQIQA